MNGTLQALAWALIHFCWQATVILGLYALIDLCLKRASSQTRYLLALTVLSLIFIVFMVTLGYEAIQSPAAPGLSVDSSLRSSGINLSVNTIVSRVGSPNAMPAGFRWAALLPWLDGLWLTGVIGLSIRSFRGWLWLQRLRRITIERAPQAIQTSFEKTCTKLGMKRLPELRMSQIVSGPITIGVLRALVLVPTSALLALSPEQLEAVFAHELAHVRRADYFWNLLQTLAETLFFFHPAVWWLGKRLREQRELCCDDIAVETCSNPLVYATALFRLEEQRSAGLALAMPLDGHPSRITFRSRILRILGETIPESQSVRLRPLSILAACASLFFFLSPLPRAMSVAAQSLPVKQVLAVPKEIASAAKHIAMESTHRTSAPRRPGRDWRAVETQFSPVSNPSETETTDSAAQALEFATQRKVPKIHGKFHAVHRENTPDETVQMLALDSQLESNGTTTEAPEHATRRRIPKIRGKVHAIHRENPPEEAVQTSLK